MARPGPLKPGPIKPTPILGRYFLTSLFTFVFLGLLATPIQSQELNAQQLESQLRSNSDLMEITHWPELVIDLKYSTTDNFLHEDLYGDFQQAWLHKNAAEKLKKAIGLLQRKCDGCKLVIYDALRPRRIQRKMWAYVVPLKKTLYVANPAKGSIHNFGFAIDLSIVDAEGVPLDMGTPFDSFKPIAQPRYEQDFLKQGKLTALQVENREVLREVMTQAGFFGIYSEWWHFNALPSKVVRAKFKLVE